MPSSMRPGCVVRSTLALFGILFLPLAVWFAYVNWRRYWGDALVLLSTGLIFLRLATTRDESSWISALDDVGEPGNSNDVDA